MAILERRIQKISKSEDEYREWEKKWEGVEKSVGGFAAKRHYSLISGHDESGTMVWEREWASLGALEAAYNKLFESPEARALGASAAGMIASDRTEFYFVW